MKDRTTHFRSDDRGASEVFGAVILISIALVGGLVVVGTGTLALDSVNDQVDRENAESVLQEVDSRFDSLTSSSDTPRTEMDLGAAELNNYRVADSGYFTVTVNQNPACSVNQTMSGIRYEGPDEQAYLYQAGGVWTLNGDASTAITLPNVEYREGALDVTLNNLSGEISGSELTITEDVAQSRAQTNAATAALTQDDCRRPDNVTVELSSPVYRGWASYLEEETGTSVTTDSDDRTVRFFLNQSQLPRKVNDSRNSVVNLSAPSYMRNVGIFASNGTITVDKDAGNTYSVFAEPLTQDRLDIADIRFLEESTNTTRRPLDVMLVLDESGSMANDDGDSTTRSEEAKSAAREFIGNLNESRDRAGVVSYDSWGFSAPKSGATYRMTDGGQYLSSDFSSSGVNGSIEDISDTPSGGTRLDHGLFNANNVLGFKSDDVRKKVIIALTDGVNNGCTDTNDNDPADCLNNRRALEHATQSARDGTTVYTIGFGDDGDIDEAFLEEAANRTGGNYYQAENADELTDVFQEIRKDVNEQRFVARTPLSTNFTTGNGDIVTPQIAGDNGDIANVSDGDEVFQNVNDPTAPSKFSHSFAISDGETVHINVSTYECDTYEQIQKTYTNNSNTYSVVRCADINESAGATDTKTPTIILRNGDDASPLIDSEPGFWENDFNETLTQYPSVRLNGTTGKIEMESNQAVVVFDLPDSRQSENKFAMLYQVGLSESESTAEGVINVNVNKVHLSS
ncbi:MAG: VWA domain-containing protein [Haloarculaceae archaeon]